MCRTPLLRYAATVSRSGAPRPRCGARPRPGGRPRRAARRPCFENDRSAPPPRAPPPSAARCRPPPRGRGSPAALARARRTASESGAGHGDVVVLIRTASSNSPGAVVPAASRGTAVLLSGRAAAGVVWVVQDLVAWCRRPPSTKAGVSVAMPDSRPQVQRQALSGQRRGRDPPRSPRPRVGGCDRSVAQAGLAKRTSGSSRRKDCSASAMAADHAGRLDQRYGTWATRSAGTVGLVVTSPFA